MVRHPAKFFVRRIVELRAAELAYVVGTDPATNVLDMCRLDGLVVEFQCHWPSVFTLDGSRCRAWRPQQDEGVSADIFDSVYRFSTTKPPPKTAVRRSRNTLERGSVQAKGPHKRTPVKPEANKARSDLPALPELLPTLRRFLEQLTPNEWEALTLAAKKRRKKVKPKFASFSMSVATQLPLEVVPISFNRDATREVIGVVLLRRNALEAAIQGARGGRDAPLESRPEHIPPEDQTKYHCDKLVDELADNIGPWLADILALPLSHSCLLPEDCLRLIEALPIQQLSRWLWVPSVVHSLDTLLNQGPQEAKRVKQLLRSWMSRPGRPTLALTEQKDVQVFNAWSQAAADQKFQEGAALFLRRKKAGTYASDDDLIILELKKIGLDANQIDAIVGCRTVQGAINGLVALKYRLQPSSVKTIVSRARNNRRKAYLACLG